MDSKYLFTHREEFKEKPANHDEIMQICEMVQVRRDNGRRRKNVRRRDRVQAVWQEDDPLIKSLNFIYNKLSESNLDIIFKETVRLLSLMQDYPQHLEYVVHDIFVRGVKNSYLIGLYVQLFKKLVVVYANIHPLLISICEYLFYTHFNDEKLGVICNFVSQMYIEELVSRETIVYCFETLLVRQKYFEFCCLLEKHIIEFYGMYKVKVDALYMDKTVTNKVKFKITDIYDLLESS